jgi:hypothetical protein
MLFDTSFASSCRWDIRGDGIDRKVSIGLASWVLKRRSPYLMEFVVWFDDVDCRECEKCLVIDWEYRIEG